MRIARPDDLVDLAALGLTLAEGKRILAGVQREIVAAQARLHAMRRPECRGCGDVCRVKDQRVCKPVGAGSAPVASCLTGERGLVPKLVWRMKLVAELGPGVVTETEVARIERDEEANLADPGLRLDEAKRLTAALQAGIVAAQGGTAGR